MKKSFIAAVALNLFTFNSTIAQVGVWDFDDPENPGKATVGQDLVFEGQAPSFSASLADPSGSSRSGVIATVLGPENRVRVNHQIAPEAGEMKINDYTLVYDFFSPLSSEGLYRNFYQTDRTNAVDGNLYISTDNRFYQTEVGVVGPQFDPTKWQRLVVSVSNGNFYRVYANGELLFESEPRARDGFFGLGTDADGNGDFFYVFTDDNNENPSLNVGHLELYDTALSPDSVKALGGVGDVLVRNTNDSGVGSLRDALARVESNGRIRFDPTMSGKTIQLNSELVVDKSLTIDASSLAAAITISGRSNGDDIPDEWETRCFLVDDGESELTQTVLFYNLNIVDGVYDGSPGDAQNVGGGGIFNREILVLFDCEIRRCRTFNLHPSQANGGGGIYSAFNSTLSLKRSGVTDCESTHGGGIYGGGLFTDLENSFLTRNRATTHGGGLYAIGGGFIHNSTFSLNEAGEKGGAMFLEEEGHEMAIYRTTIHDNKAGTAAAMYVGHSPITLYYSTVTENVSESGGAVVSAVSTATLEGSILRDNSPSDIQVVQDDLENQSNTFISSGRNFVGSGTAEDLGLFVAEGDVTGEGEPIRLSPLGYYGGLTQTRHPLAGSPVINAGKSLVGGDNDQRGYTLVDGLWDVGAVEVGPSYYVTTALDSVADDGLLSLREALLEHSELGARILFDPTVFSAGNRSIALTLGELEIIDCKGIIVDAYDDSNSIVINGGENSRLLSLNEQSSAAFMNVVFTNGKAPDGDSEAESDLGKEGKDGGGILNLGNLTLINSWVANSAAGSTDVAGRKAGHGGGIFNGSGTLQLVGSYIENCRAGSLNVDSGQAGEGGGIYNDGGTLVLDRCRISSNYAADGGYGYDLQADGGRGGGIWSTGGRLTIRETEIMGNRAGSGGLLVGDGFGSGGGRGGAIFIEGGSLLIADSFVHGNRAGSGTDAVGNWGDQSSYGGDGGGIFAIASVTVTDTTFSENAAGSGGSLNQIHPSSKGGIRAGAGGWGGGLFVDGDLTMDNCTFVANRAGDGGSITFNISEGFGGHGGSGGAVFNSFGTLNITSCTIARNEAGSLGRGAAEDGTPGYGGGVYAYGQASVGYSIIADNKAQSFAPDFYSLYDPYVYGPSLITNVNSTGLSAGANLIVANPLLGQLADNGGFAPTLLPHPDSPVIDAVNVGLYNAHDDAVGISDQRGRPIVGLPDIGAAEFQGMGDYSNIWTQDFDGDGKPFGLEISFGREGAEESEILDFSFSDEGYSRVQFYTKSNSYPFTTWSLLKSLDLENWEELVRYDNSGQSFEKIAEGVVVGEGLNGLWIVTDKNSVGLSEQFFKLVVNYTP